MSEIITHARRLGLPVASPENHNGNTGDTNRTKVRLVLMRLFHEWSGGYSRGRRQGGANKRMPKDIQGNEVVYEKDHYRLSLLRQLDRETRKAYFIFRS